MVIKNYYFNVLGFCEGWDKKYECSNLALKPSFCKTPVGGWLYFIFFGLIGSGNAKIILDKKGKAFKSRSLKLRYPTFNLFNKFRYGNSHIGRKSF